MLYQIELPKQEESKIRSFLMNFACVSPTQKDPPLFDKLCHGSSKVLEAI
jgi:hypothetical protein